MSSTSPSTMNKPPIVRSYSLAENIFSGDGSLLGSFSGWGTERILVLSTSKTPSLVSTSVQKQLSVIADTSNPTVAVMNGCCMATTSDNPHHDSNSSSSDGSSSSNNDNQHHVLNEKKHIGLNVLQSVSIAGCDLLGSCLYTAGVCASNGGKVRKIQFITHSHCILTNLSLSLSPSLSLACTYMFTYGNNNVILFSFCL